MKLDKKSLLLYAITDRSWLNGASLESAVEKALKGGATFLQLREKNLSAGDFLSEAEKLMPLAKSYNVPFVINDDVELAVKCGADGVHVGQSDIKGRDIRAIIGPDMILGVSANTVETAKRAEQSGADYIGVGAVFGTSTKKDAKNVSTELLKEICQSVSIPVVAIGGISENNILELCGSGICGASVISAIFAAKDIEKATANLKKLCEQVVKGK